MKKLVRMISILCLFVISFSSVVPAFAQDDTPPVDQPERPLRDYVTAAFASALGLDLSAVEDRLAAGDGFRVIAAEQGIEGADFIDLMTGVIEEAVDQAINDGVISEEDAERMRERYQEHRQNRRQRRRQKVGRKILERLGITQEELAEMRESGMSWAEIFEELGVEAQWPKLREKVLERLGLSREELQERLEAGETLREIFASEGIEFPGAAVR